MFAVISQPHFKLLTSFTLFTLLRKEALVQTKTQVFSYVEERKKNMTGYRIETADIGSVDESRLYSRLQLTKQPTSVS